MDVHQKLYDCLHSGAKFSLVTVVLTCGSTPRNAGTKMLVSPDGDIIGTIGGGCPEAEAWKEAKEAAVSGHHILLDVDLNHNLEKNSEEELMICGGRLRALVEPFGSDPEKTLFLEHILELMLNEHKPVVNIVSLGQPGDQPQTPPLGYHWLYTESTGLEGQAELPNFQLKDELAKLGRKLLENRLPGWYTLSDAELGQRIEVFAEVITPTPHFIIAGAGHVSKPLATLANMCGFAVTVDDDRPKYADPKFFAQGVSVRNQPFSEFLTSIKNDLDKTSAVVLVTRGHKHDEECLQALKGSNLGYIGMIGSRRRTSLILQRLIDDGADPQWVKNVHSPIGLDIGGETPEEIAVAVMAEVIGTLRGGTFLPLYIQRRTNNN